MDRSHSQGDLGPIIFFGEIVDERQFLDLELSIGALRLRVAGFNRSGRNVPVDGGRIDVIGIS